VSKTLSFLVDANDEVSKEISEYIRASLSHAKAFEWLESWKIDRHELIANEDALD